MRMITVGIILLTSTTALAGDPKPVTGSFERGTRYAAPAEHAPAAASRMFVKTLTAAEARNGVELPATGNGGLIVWTMPLHAKQGRLAADAVSTRQEVRATLTTPTGTELKSGDDGSLDRGLRRFRFDSAELGIDLPRGAQEVIHVAGAEAASYRLALDLPAETAGVTVIGGEPESRLVLSTWAAPLSRQPGQPVTLHADLREGDDAVTGARVFARLAAKGGRASEPVELFDDGMHSDGAANDGAYAAVLRELPSATPGLWTARIEADGRTSRGVGFARTGSAELMNERGAGRLSPRIDAQIVGDALRVTTRATMAIEGSYRYDVIVAGAKDASGERAALGWAESIRQLGKGETDLVVDLPLNELGIDSTDGLFLDVRLLGMDEPGLAGRVTREMD